MQRSIKSQLLVGHHIFITVIRTAPGNVYQALLARFVRDSTKQGGLMAAAWCVCACPAKPLSPSSAVSSRSTPALVPPARSTAHIGPIKEVGRLEGRCGERI